MAVPGNRRQNMTIDGVWEDLYSGLQSVYLREVMKSQRYMELYTSVYDFCTAISVNQSPGVVGRAARSSARSSHRNFNTEDGAASGTDFVGVEMYSKLTAFIESYVREKLEGARDLLGEDLLLYYTTQWSEFRFSSKVVDGIFSYLNRHWIKRELDEGNGNIYMIYTLALVIWKRILFMESKERVTDAVLDLIRRERNGETVCRKLIRDVTDCYVELGIEEDENPNQDRTAQPNPNAKLKVYMDHFEAKFLKETENYYANEAQAFLEHNPLTEYMKKVERRLDDERARCDMYLHMATQEPLSKTCEKVLIEAQLELFQHEFGALLEANKDDDLARMYKLCERVEDGLSNLRSALEVHITKEGLAAIAKVADAAFTDAKLYITTILTVHNRYSSLVGTAFQNESGFIQALDKAATTFINKNAVTRRSPQQLSKSPELLAKYCDQLLRKSSKMPEENELEDMLVQVVSSIILKNSFTQKLISETSASEEAEVSLINKLKQMCGFEYTNRLSKMINDTQISKDSCCEFREYLNNRKIDLKMDFNMLILSSGSWPALPTLKMHLPQKLNVAIEQFTSFYNSKHSGRKLTWVLSQSRGEMYSYGFGKKYVLTTTTAQMAVLLLFNESIDYSINSLVTSLGMDKKTLVQVLISLIKNDVLNSSESIDTSVDPNDGIIISLNQKYSNKKVKVDLSKMVMRSDPKQETEHVQKNVDEDRKSVISVLQQLTARFKPSVDMVKRCIGQLIEKEYMRRDETARDMYEYMA
ncbi:cullin family protein [Dictyocaulus viviparus]|uniref:Cullin family protein n=1 Tax=Dictyocaulus viviparus TaxID=29172 RepID=A0A0D8XB73_DICVI|nr:cullin family protein [Dictyocaulus viviparus]